MDRSKKIAAEFLGTFILVFAGAGAIVVNARTGGELGHVGICLVFGLVVMALIYSIGNVSGAHINPAVSIGFVMARKFPVSEAVGYITAQFTGSLCASYCLYALLGNHAHMGATLPAPDISWQQAFAFETILTFILMFVILNVSTGAMEKGIMAGIAIGGTVALEALVAGPICGASMNPARSLGPAVASGVTQHIWIYLIAPVLGAVLAAPTCKLIQGRECCASCKGDSNG
ncbi:MAG: MIP family channel protein [Planctomycetes bacterium]|nr:MIP family channel protein [Planctomycetota bacterium]